MTSNVPLEYNSNLSYYNPQPSVNNQQQSQQNYSQHSSHQHNNSYGMQSQQQSGYGFQPVSMNSQSYAGSIPPFGSSIDSGLSNSGFGSDFDNEPPLLEELGIDLRSIWANTLAVSLPFTSLKSQSERNDRLAEADLAGVSRCASIRKLISICRCTN
jgi:hypothetical protein